MTPGAPPESNDLRCTVQATELGEGAAGTAGFARRVLLVELPLPWPKKIDQHELLAGVRLGDDVSLLGLRATDEASSEHHRIIVWERTDPFRGFERTETIVARAGLVGSINQLVETGPSSIDDPIAPDADIEDLLVCTHGSRDRCCGQLGTIMHMELAARIHELPSDGPAIRVWRTSHTGGHRFAPTGVHFPSGTTWASLTADLAMAILEEAVATHRLEPHFRGNLGIAGRPAQIAEGRAFLDRGWPFLEQERVVDVDDVGDDSVLATVRSATGVHRVRLEPRPPLPVPVCGEPIEASKKATPQFVVVEETNH